MPKDKSSVESGLLSKGFRSHEGDHRYFIYWSEDGRKSMAKTKTSHGTGKDVSDDLIAQMARQCGLTKQNFLRLVECPLQRSDYEVLLRQANRL
jgi:hypothetical protein